MAITWTSDLDTGIEAIDNQHKRIVNCINQLENAIKQHDRLSVEQVLVELLDYTVSHFVFEENLLEEAGYKLAKPHKAMHDIFVKRIEMYQQRYNAGEDVAEELHGMLCTWLLHHIKRDDMAAFHPPVTDMISDKDENTNMVREKADGNWFTRSLGKIFKY